MSEITDHEIRSLRREALEHADWAQDAVCQRALGADDDEIRELVNLTDREMERVLGMSREEAAAECARVIDHARAQ